MRNRFGFGEMLVRDGYITPEQLQEALEYQTEHNIKLGEALIDMNLVDEEVLVDNLASQLGIEVIKRPLDMDVDQAVVDHFPEHFVRTYKCFPVSLGEGTVNLLVLDPLNLIMEDEILQETGRRCEFYLTYETEIDKMIEKYYDQKQVMRDLEGMDMEELDKDFFDVDATNENSPVVRLVNSIFKGAVVEGASDIHIAPQEENVIVRYRIDGILHKVRELPKKAHAPLSVRIKSMGEMDITDKRIPHDGRIQINLDGKAIDMRVSTLPSVHGEKITIRLLDKSNLLLNIKELGFEESNQEKFEKLIARPVGIVLITGPTGSGKSTTLYTALDELNDVTKNIITVEDPVEYRLDGIVQVQVNHKAGLDFAAGLKSILRQDPDIILVGEIRDKETAQIAAKASNTGHLVLSTLHTNDAVSSIMRLLDMEVDPYLVASTVSGIVNQRLVRRVCSKCKVSYKSKGYSADRKFFGIQDEEELTLYKGEGCDHCKGTGYKGRLPIQELLVVDDKIKRMIAENKGESEILEAALANGMLTLKQDGLSKALEGSTTLEEVKRFVVE